MCTSQVKRVMVNKKLLNITWMFPPQGEVAKDSMVNFVASNLRTCLLTVVFFILLPHFSKDVICLFILPSGKIPTIDGKTHNKWSFSIAILT